MPERSWQGVLKIVFKSGYLNVPGVAACALARCCGSKVRCLNVIDRCNNSLDNGLWDATFSGVVQCVAATVGIQFSGAVADFITTVLNAGAVISGGTVVRVVCAGTATSQSNMDGWSGSDLDIMIAEGGNTGTIMHAIDKFALCVKNHWNVQPIAYHHANPHNRYHAMTSCTSVTFHASEQGCFATWKIDVLETKINVLAAISYFDINVCRVALSCKSLHSISLQRGRN